MSATVLDGKALSKKLREGMAEEVALIAKETGRQIGLAVILVGEDPASTVYVRNKIRACEEVGVRSFQYRLPAETTQDELITLIRKLNADDEVNGILVQLPLPKGLNESAVLEEINYEKDVDGFHERNAGKLFLGNGGLVACTPSGCMELIAESGVSVSGKRAVVIGRSNIVGKPMAMLLLNANATVTVCHSRTQNIAEVTREADILVAAVGRPNFVTADMVKPGAVVIDVGINRLDGKLVGDVEYSSVSEVAGYITPVPGGVGPMTITMLMKNTILAAKQQWK
ncbi:MAG: bifunctional methylenetetrahydrofolate dehydrogenase/methenyltetrahydrofolate cyclohydrolase FolD [Clostridia bacterium]|nr:bifunctional methylenetetrahydrofolate dehydrogenase/methenyltetrahydrofolate cyclohydrolase FolD [Clostridia bacterium]